MKLFLFVFFGVVLCWLFGSLDVAAGERGLTVTPVFQEIILTPEDTTQEFAVSLTNDMEALVTLGLSVFDFGGLDESGGVAFLGASSDLEKKYALASWMRPEKDTLTLDPGETGQVRVTIENRENLSPGGHYGALTFRAESESRADGAESAIAVNQLFATLVFVKKVGGEIYGLELKSREYDANIVKFADVLRLRFQNSGNVHVVPRGVAIVTDPLGRAVAKGTINQESALILPETLRVYPVRLNTLATSFIPGRYTMEIAYRYDGKDDFTTVTDTRVFIPPLFIGSMFAAALGIGAYLRKRKSS